MAALLRRPQHLGTFLPAESLARDPWRRRARRSRPKPRPRLKPRRVPPSMFRRNRYVRVPRSAAHLRKQAPQPAAAVNARARRVCIAHAVKLSTRSRNANWSFTTRPPQARGQEARGQEVARQGQEEPQEVARGVRTRFLGYSRDRVIRRPAPKKATPKKPAAKSPKKPVKARVLRRSSSRHQSFSTHRPRRSRRRRSAERRPDAISMLFP